MTVFISPTAIRRKAFSMYARLRFRVLRWFI